MKLSIGIAVLGFAISCGSAAHAQTEAEEPFSHSVSTDVFASTDADDTTVLRTGINLDFKYKAEEQLIGVRYEEAWYKPIGQHTRARERGFVRYADSDKNWVWSTQVGTDGHTILGAASVHNNAHFRQEFFVERDIVETPLGVDEGIYFTFVGTALDLPINENNGFTLAGGIQEFTGENVRYHVRGTFTHVLKSDWGVSFQLRSRYYHSTDPGEFDYYSPSYYAQILPTVQMRRFRAGWRYMLAVGLGAQRDSETDWGQSRYAAAEVTSPMNTRGWFVKAAALYSNTPLRSGIYDYGQLTLSVGRRF